MKHVTLAVCLVALALGTLPLPVSAADPTTLTVGGTGSITKTPDSALVDTDIVTNDEASAAKATDQNNAAYNTLRDRLRALGVRDDAIRTTSFNVHYVPRPQQLRQPLAAPSIPGPAQRYGYVASRNVTITAPRVDAAGRVVDAAVAVGANVNGVRYTLTDQRAAVAQALSAAVSDAQMQADAVASAAHMHITGIKSIDVQGSPMPIAFRAAAGPVASNPTELQPSPLDIRANVSVTYYLSP